MKRHLLLLISGAILVAVASIASQQRQDAGSHPVLLRAAQSADAVPPVAILLEMGIGDTRSADWSGEATVKGARVVRRAGYRFRGEDKLIEPKRWQAASRRAVRAPKNNPIIKRLEPMATVGVVFYLEPSPKQAVLTLEMDEKALPKGVVPLDKVMAGEKVTLWNGSALVRRISTAQPVATGPTEDDQPAAAYGPDGTLWAAYTSYTLRDESRRIEQHNFPKQPANFQSLYHPEYTEQLFVRSYKAGQWSEPIAITDNHQDIARCAVAVTGTGTVWAIYSAHRDDNFAIYARPLHGKGGKMLLGEEQRLASNDGPDLTPVACADAAGHVWVAYQSWTDGRAQIWGIVNRNGVWGKAQPVIDGQTGNCWYPALAADSKGQVAIACDTYADSNYDVVVNVGTAEKMPVPTTARKVASGDHFQARPALVYDVSGRLWVAYEYGPEKWGKDYGALDSKDGYPLYSGRTVRVVCVDGVKLLRPAAELPPLEADTPQLPFNAIKTNQYERRSRFAYPKIGLDGKGRVWLTYRRNFGSRYTSHPGSYWLTYARRLDGKAWSPEMELHHSDGLPDHRPILLPHPSGGLLVVHNTDGRYTTPETINNEIYLSVLDVSKPQAAPVLADEISLKGSRRTAEADDIQRVRAYRLKIGGKEYRLLRGEFHRHTAISWDGAPDGSLEDMFRYAIDAAGMDWIGNGDHDNGAGREYPWWLIQKWSDAYHVARRFTPMFTYERSVSYPHGHRNVMFDRRGIMTLPRLAAAAGQKAVAGVHPDDTRMLYRYLHEFGGICASHTSATGMGTDWRDNDSKVEPVVEIYQGDRMSYEYIGAPKAGYDPQDNKFPANAGGWKPAGFIDNALRDKGYKIAFQSSSDHWSTHLSYFVVLAEEHSRTGILAAVKKRHTYAATDNIIVDLRCGEYMQGDEFTTNMAPKLEFNVVGTNTLTKLDVLKDSEVTASFTPKKRAYRGSWTEPNPDGRAHYYYIRVQQQDGEMAWASPLWIQQRK